MKRYIKKVAAIVTLLVCVCLLGACSDTKETLDPVKEEEIASLGENYVSQVAAIDDATLESYIIESEESGDTIGAAGFKSWLDAKEETGNLVSIDSTEVAESDDGYMITMNYTGELRNGTISMGVNEKLTELTSFTCTPYHTMAEKMTDAALNMVMGMGTVFAVLIIIIFVISLFKYISVFENMFNKKSDTQKAASSAPVQPAALAAVSASENLAGDSQLAAVITAAIAAYEGTSTDGLIVRSIKRKPSNWKNAL